MDQSDAFRALRCTATGEELAADPTRTGPSEAGAPVDPVYDVDGVDWDHAFLAGARSVWDFADLLPFESGVSAAEGGTPLVDAPALADELGVDSLFVKDEGRNPTGTVLDRGLSLAVTAAVDAGADLVAHASAGNSGQSGAAYAGRASLRSYAFVPSRAPFPNKAMTNVHGGDMRVAGGRYPDAVEALQTQLKSDWFTLQEFDNPVRHEGYKTIAYELVGEGCVPDAVFVPASTGEVVYGLVKGFHELDELGLVDDLPQVVAAQPTGCAPIAAAFDSGREVEAWNQPDTIVGELEIPDPKGGDLVVDAVDATGGRVVTVDDDATLGSAVAAAQTTAVDVGSAGGAAAAAADALADEFDEDATLVVVNTEAGVKTADILRSHLMGQGI
ncbi:threonine synthase [Salinigranum halophilum]|uniref:threonine synthase n=1 Tax=Salinigranum halophilum TaxID=2565931 RepID=UPI0010A92905|nr:pyridoxal-phosphate dependent enzyme [Salinigranum halophilum]